MGIKNSLSLLLFYPNCYEGTVSIKGGKEGWGADLNKSVPIIFIIFSLISLWRIRMYYYGIILFLLAAVGCAPSTTQRLRENHAGRYEFSASENYQSVYRKVLYQSRECHQIGFFAAPMIVQGDLFQDLKSGNITVAMHAAYGVDTILTVDVSALDDKTTNVIVYSAFSTWNSAAMAVREWVIGNSTECKSQKE